MFHLDPPTGFQGYRKELNVDISERHLPHWRQKGATYFVTFRLADSLPLEQQKRLHEIKSEWEQGNPKPHSHQQREELVHLVGKHVEKWLDAGMGNCILRRASHRKIVESAINYFDQLNDQNTSRYETGAWVIMPNHVHILIRTLDDWSLSKILQSWKRQTAREINLVEKSAGKVWMSESFDRIVRDPQHLWRCLQYIGRNPHKAKLRDTEYSRWVSPQWQNVSWTFDDIDPT